MHRDQTAAAPVHRTPSNGLYNRLADRDSRPTPPRPEYRLLNDAGMYATSLRQIHQDGYAVLERAGHEHRSAGQTYADPTAAGTSA